MSDPARLLPRPWAASGNGILGRLAALRVPLLLADTRLTISPEEEYGLIVSILSGVARGTQSGRVRHLQQASRQSGARAGRFVRTWALLISLGYPADAGPKGPR